MALWLVLVGLLHCCGCASSPETWKDITFRDPDVQRRAVELQEKIRMDPADVASHCEFGRLLVREGLFDRAAAELEEALRLDPRHVRAHLLLALTLQKQAKPDLRRAMAISKEAVDLAPKNADARLALAQVYNSVKEYDEAAAEFTRAIELSKEPETLVSAHLGLMAIHKRQGKQKEADDHYRQARRIYPSVDELIQEAEIRRITPPPRYVGDEYEEEGGFHPGLDERAKRAQREADRVKEKNNE
jgi:tetratricopeptide (TPR) repeat protein